GLVGAAAIAGGAVLFASRSSGGHASSKTVGAIVFAVLGALGLAFAWWLYRRASGGPRPSPVSLARDPTELARGDQVRANVTVQGDVTGLQVGLVCTAYVDTKRETVNSNGSTSTSRVIVTNDVIADWHDLAAGSPMHSVEFVIPADGPFSYEGAT